MSSLTVRLPAAILLAACGVLARNNALTADEFRNGYELLWNGRDYAGWLVNDQRLKPSPPDAFSDWSIVTEAGVESPGAHRSASADSNVLEIARAGVSLFTRDSAFLDFDLKFEWQTPAERSG